MDCGVNSVSVRPSRCEHSLRTIVSLRFTNVFRVVEVQLGGPVVALVGFDQTRRAEVVGALRRQDSR